MDILHIEAKSKIEIIPVIEKALDKLPKRIGLVTTIQHLHQLAEAKEFLSKKGINALIAGQILGCDASSAVKIKDKVDAFLYIGSGEFHPVEIALETKKRTITANPFSGIIGEVKKEQIENIEKRQKGALMRFLSSDKIGILVSLKPGQNKLKQALKLKEKLEKKGKEAYIFVADNLDLKQCENFPFIQSWVNTACPRIADDKPGVLNYDIALRGIK